MYPIHSVNDVRDERFNISDMENTISLKIMNNNNEKSPRHFLKIPDGKLTIHFLRPYDKHNMTNHTLPGILYAMGRVTGYG